MNKVRVISIGRVVLLALGLVGGTSVAAAVPEPELLTGDVWQRMAADAKIAYIWGLGNLVEYERHQLVDSPPATSKSFLPHLARGLSGISVNEVVSHIDAFYAAHPEQLKRPVVDTMNSLQNTFGSWSNGIKFSPYWPDIAKVLQYKYLNL